MTRRATDEPAAPAGGTRLDRGEITVLVLVLAAAVALRAAYLLEIRAHPLFTVLMGDPAVYYAQAADILSGRLVPDHAYFHSSPLYPFVLALITKVAGTGLEKIRIAQSCIGTVSVWLVFVLARHTVGKRAALAAAAFAALYVPLVFFEAEVLEITLVIACVLGMLTLLTLARERGSVSKAAFAGALLGAAGLGKPNLLLFAPVGAVWLFLTWTAGRARARILPAALFFLTAGFAVLPATVHNYRAEGDFIPVSSNGGINFFIGNHSNSPGVFQVPPEMRFDLRTASKAAAERATGRTLSAGEVSDYWTRTTLRQIADRPGRWLLLMGRKFALFWNHYEIPNHYHLDYVRGFAPALRLPVGTFAVVAPLGVFGVLLALRRRRPVGLLAAFGITFMASVLPFFITARYRLAIVPVLLVGAGYALDALWRGLRTRAWRRVAFGAAAVGVLAIAVNVNVIEFGFSQMHNSVGAILGRRGDMKGAAREFGKAVLENPRDLSSRYNLGLALLELGRFPEAANHFEQAVAQYPQYIEAWIGLARARAALGDSGGALGALREAAALEPPDEVAAEIERLSAEIPRGGGGLTGAPAADGRKGEATE